MPSFTGRNRGQPPTDDQPKSALDSTAEAFIRPASQSAFELFYQQHAPKLWGIILLANLPVSLSEDILVDTLTAAWQQRQDHALEGTYVLSWLITLAHRAGLPYERVQAILAARLKPFTTTRNDP